MAARKKTDSTDEQDDQPKAEKSTKESKKTLRDKNRDILNAIVKQHEAPDKITKPKLFWGTDLAPRTFVATGITALDNAMGGGIALGAYTVVYAPERAGKSTFAARCAGNFQKAKPDQFVLWLDIERTADEVWLAKQGIDVKNVVFLRGGVFEEDMQRIVDMMKTGVVSLIVVDSVQALARMADIQKAAKPDKGAGEKSGPKIKEIQLTEEAKMGGHGAVLSRFFRVATTFMSDDLAMILIGQVRDNTDSYSALKDYMPGGKAIQHYAGSRLRLTRVYGKDKAPKRKDDKGKEVITGFPCRIALEKTKFSDNDGQIIDVNFLFGIGFDEFESNIDAAVAADVIVRSGAWYEYKGEKVMGRTALSDLLKSNPDLYQQVLQEAAGDTSEEVADQLVDEETSEDEPAPTTD